MGGGRIQGNGKQFEYGAGDRYAWWEAVVGRGGGRGRQGRGKSSRDGTEKGEKGAECEAEQGE